MPTICLSVYNVCVSCVLMTGRSRCAQTEQSFHLGCCRPKINNKQLTHDDLTCNIDNSTKLSKYAWSHLWADINLLILPWQRSSEIFLSWRLSKALPDFWTGSCSSGRSGFNVNNNEDSKKLECFTRLFAKPSSFQVRRPQKIVVEIDTWGCGFWGSHSGNSSTGKGSSSSSHCSYNLSRSASLRRKKYSLVNFNFNMNHLVLLNVPQR